MKTKCRECRNEIEADDHRAGYGLCGGCLHDALRSGWEPTEAEELPASSPVLVATLDVDAVFEAAGSSVWPELCQAAYGLLRVVDDTASPTAIEPHGHVDGLFEWRTYLHPADGSAPLYVRIRRLPATTT